MWALFGIYTYKYIETYIHILYIYIYMYIYIYIYTYIYIHIYIYVCTQIHIYTHINIIIHARMYTHTHAHCEPFLGLDVASCVVALDFYACVVFVDVGVCVAVPKSDACLVVSTITKKTGSWVSAVAASQVHSKWRRADWCVCASSCVWVCGCTCVRAPCCVYNSVRPFVVPYIRRSLVQMSSPKTVLFSKRTLTINLNRHKCISIYIHTHMWVHACVHISVRVQVCSTLYHHDTSSPRKKNIRGRTLRRWYQQSVAALDPPLLCWVCRDEGVWETGEFSFVVTTMCVWNVHFPACMYTCIYVCICMYT